MRRPSCKLLLLLPPSEMPGQAEYECPSYTNHQQSDVAGAILFQSRNSQESLTWCLAAAQPDWALVLTFKPRFAGKQNSTWDMFLASSQFLLEHGCVGRHADMAHMCDMIQAMTYGEQNLGFRGCVDLNGYSDWTVFQMGDLAKLLIFLCLSSRWVRFGM